MSWWRLAQLFLSFCNACDFVAVGYISRRAMLQQLHGISTFSHDERHYTAHTWMNKGKTPKRWLRFYPSMWVEVSCVFLFSEVGSRLEVLPFLLHQKPSISMLLLRAGVQQSEVGSWLSICISLTQTTRRTEGWMKTVWRKQDYY